MEKVNEWDGNQKNLGGFLFCLESDAAERENAVFSSKFPGTELIYQESLL